MRDRVSGQCRRLEPAGPVPPIQRNAALKRCYTRTQQDHSYSKTDLTRYQ